MKKNIINVFFAMSLSTILLAGCGKKHTHSFGDWEVETPATHTSVGLETRTCECGESEERDIPKIEEHNWVLTETVNPEYSTDKGHKLYTCECGEQYTEEIEVLKNFVKTFTISDFDVDTRLAEVTVTFEGFDDIVIDGLETAEKETDEFYVPYSVTNAKIVKDKTNFSLKSCTDLLHDIEANCDTYHIHYHNYSNGVCACGEETFRFVIEDVFSITGKGTVLVGTVEGKAIALGDKIQKYDATSNTFVEYTISSMESFHQSLDVAEPGTNVGISFEEAPATTDFSRGTLLVSEEGNWTPVTTISGIIHLPYRHNPLFSSYRPQFYYNGTEVTGVVTIPSDLEYVMPEDMATVSVEFVNPILMLDKTEFVVREGGRTAGFFVVGYEEDELGTFVPAVSVKYPSTPGATPTNHTLVDAYYIDENGNTYNDLALLKEVEINNSYDYFIGINTSMVITGRGTVIVSELTPYDNLGVEWVVSSNQDGDNILLNKTCTLIAYDSDTNMTVENEYVITGAIMPTEGKYLFIIRGLSYEESQKVIAMYIAS